MLDMARRVMNALHVSQECPAVKTPERRWFVKVCRVMLCGNNSYFSYIMIYNGDCFTQDF